MSTLAQPAQALALSRPTTPGRRFLLPFLLGVGTFMNVRLVGYVTISELVVAGYFVFLVLTQGLTIKSATMKWLMTFGLIWIGCAVATDLYRHSDFQQFARGFGRTVVLFCSLSAGYVFFRRDPRALKPLFLGLVISTVINIWGFRAGTEEFELINGYELASSWERNYTYVTLMLSFCAAAYLYRRFPVTTAVVVAAVGALNIAMGSRNLGGTIIAGAVIAVMARWVLKPVSGTAKSSTALFIMTGLITFTGGSVYIAYKMAAAHGLLGQKSYEKYQAQAGSPLGVLFASRADFIGGLLAIRDSPVIGYGSWPADTQGYLQEAFRLAGDDNYAKELNGLSYVRIPSHSMLLEAWVEHGMLAMMFWLVVVVVLARALAAGALQDREWGMVNGLVVVWMIWNLLFSPLGNRLYTALMILILVLSSEGLLQATTSRKARQPVDGAASVPRKLSNREAFLAAALRRAGPRP